MHINTKIYNTIHTYMHAGINTPFHLRVQTKSKMNIRSEATLGHHDGVTSTYNDLELISNTALFYGNRYPKWFSSYLLRMVYGRPYLRESTLTRERYPKSYGNQGTRTSRPT
jgi:hypothetical protein